MLQEQGLCWEFSNTCPSEGLLTLGLPALDLGSGWREGVGLC